LNIREAAQRGLALLQSVSTEYFKASGCVGCHHQPLAGLAAAAADRAGLVVDHTAAAEQLRTISTDLMANRDSFLQGVLISIDQLNYSMLCLAESGYRADPVTDAAVALVAAQQLPDGSWDGLPLVRPPLEYSRWVRTALAARMLARYGIPARRSEFEARIAAARRWMMKPRPELPYERAFQLLGLEWTSAQPAAIASAAAELRKLQRQDGGWAQLSQLRSDAYATGVALYALQSIGVNRDDPVYRNGVRFLVQTQAADGSWYVASRAPKIQPYFQSGFPYDHDQWISAAATAWSVTALAQAAASSPDLIAAGRAAGR
jgi:hypothetical protein